MKGVLCRAARRAKEARPGRMSGKTRREREFRNGGGRVSREPHFLRPHPGARTIGPLAHGLRRGLLSFVLWAREVRWSLTPHPGARIIRTVDPRLAPWATIFRPTGSRGAPVAVHDQLARPGTDTEFASHSAGPVRACNAAGTFQVEIQSTLQRFVRGKPDVESRPLPSRYFHVREIRDGCLMLSAPTEPDRGCKGANLMP